MRKNAVAVIIALSIMFGISMGAKSLGLLVKAAFSTSEPDTFNSVMTRLNSSSGEIIDNTVSLDRFDTVKTDTTSINLYLEKGDGYSLEYHVFEEYVPQYKVDNGKLVIKQPSIIGFKGFHFDRIGEEQYYKLTVPKDAELSELDLHFTSGDFVASDIVTKETELNYTSGKAELDNFVTEEIEVDMTSGDFNCDEISFDEADIKATSGTVKIKATGNQDDYGYKLETTSGTIKIGDMVITDEFRSGSEKDKQIKVDITSCNLDIFFE